MELHAMKEENMELSYALENASELVQRKTENIIKALLLDKKVMLLNK